MLTAGCSALSSQRSALQWGRDIPPGTGLPCTSQVKYGGSTKSHQFLVFFLITKFKDTLYLRRCDLPLGKESPSSGGGF